MGTGIILCGLNGAGKSTLGRALAKEMGYHFMDSEEAFFSKENPDDPYAFPRSREEAERLLLKEMMTHEDFVLASVKGDYGAAIQARFRYAVWVDVPKELRMRRIRERSFQLFGDRMLFGGDLYEREEKFFDFVQSRPESAVEAWTQALNCPVLRVDGARPIEDNVKLLIEWLRGEGCAEKGAET